MRCSKCGFDNPGGMKFCGQCTTPLALVCPNCRFENPPGFKFCGQCTTALGSDSAKLRSSNPPTSIREADGPAALDGERKTVTALFADIRGSTELMEGLDPEEARTIVNPALKIMIEAVRRYDGYVVQSTGDGIFVLFGAPVAREDHPQRALYAALRMQEDLRRYSAKVVSEGGAPVQARVGVNTGEVVVRTLETGEGHAEYAPIGHSTNLAARMQTAAPVGSIAVTDATRKLCEGYFTFKLLGPTVVKGISEPVQVCEVTGLGPLRTRLQHAAVRGLTKFVGREREMDALRLALEQAQAGRGQIVAAIADPGVGKSRLFYEFKVISQSESMVLEAFSVSYGKASAYLPVIDLLHGYFEITSDDDARKRREKVGGKMLMLDRALEDALPYLFSLLGISDTPDPLAQTDGQVKMRRTLDAIKRVLLRESLNQPLIVIFEDLHWIDGETQALLNLLADGIANTHILLMVNYRPEYHHEWGNRSHYVQLRLDPLRSQNAAEMLSGLLGEAPELGPIKRTIIERTEGNPFFIEELVQALFDEGVLVRNGTVKIGRSISQLWIPPTAQGVLAARIDRLPAKQKELLQTLAVVGREFPVGLIQSVVPLSDAELDRMLADLQLAEFIYEQPAFPEAEYIFKHALTLQVAYDSILLERRKQIHERAAQAIEAMFATSLPDHYADLARHYVRSGNVPKAIDFLQLAASQSLSRSAYSEANAQLTAALDLLRGQVENSERDRTEIGLVLSLAMCSGVGAIRSLETSVSMLERALQLSEKIGDNFNRLKILEFLANHYSLLPGHLRRARALNSELLAIGEQQHDSELVGWARSYLGWVSMHEGDFPGALQELEHAYQISAMPSLAQRVRPIDWRVHIRAFASFALWVSGYPARATAIAEEAFEVAHKVAAAAANRIFACWWSVILNLLLRESNTASAFREEYATLIAQHGLPGLAAADPPLEWVLVQLGQTERGLSEMLRKKAEVVESGGVFAPWLFIALANAYLADGRVSEGIAAVDEGLALSRSSGVRLLESELHRLKGELLLNNGDSEAAAQSFHDAIDLARHQGAKSWELRASISLARLLSETERRDEACTRLANIYNWFTEGFDTADLRQAKALLEELGADRISS